jgi:hypothetical protein
VQCVPQESGPPVAALEPLVFEPGSPPPLAAPAMEPSVPEAAAAAVAEGTPPVSATDTQNSSSAATLRAEVRALPSLANVRTVWYSIVCSHLRNGSHPLSFSGGGTDR